MTPKERQDYGARATISTMGSFSTPFEQRRAGVEGAKLFVECRD